MDNKNCSEPLQTIKYLLTEQDDRQAMNCFLDDLFDSIYSKRKSGRRMIIISMAITLLATLFLVILDGISKHYLLVLFVVLLAAIVAGWRYINQFLLRLANQGSIKARKDAGEYDVPTEAAFYEDRFTVTNGDKHGVVSWEDVTSAFENADGLFLIHQNYAYFYIPARFFDQASAESLRTFLENKLGQKFSVKAPMHIADCAANAGEIRQTTVDADAPRFSFAFEMKGSEITNISGYNGRIILAVVGALLTVVCVWFAVSSVMDGNIRRVVYAAAVYVIVVAAGASGFIQALKSRGDISENVTLNWYDDHVTVLTEKDDQMINRVSYGKLKKLRRQKNLTAVFFKDNTFIYVPHSAAKNDDEFVEWENFLSKKIDKYSK